MALHLTSDDDADHDIHLMTPEEARREAQRETHDFVEADERRRQQVPRAIGVGVLAGLVAVAFRTILEFLDAQRDKLLHWGHGHGVLGVLAVIAWGAIGAGVGVFMVRQYAPEARGSGIPHLKSVLHHHGRFRALRVLLVKFVAGSLATGAGLVLGREGPTLQMGGAIGHLLGRSMKISPRERHTLVAAGAGAGLAAAFNAPLSGLVFVLEEVQRDFAPVMFLVSFVAAVCADVVARLLTGQLPSFHASNLGMPPLLSLPLFALLGVLAGFAGIIYNRALLGSLDLFARVSHWPKGIAAALVGALVALVGLWNPQLMGGGHLLSEATLHNQIGLKMVFLFLLLRFALAIFSYGTGAAGGIFAPLLGLGALLGLGIGQIGHLFLPTVVIHPENYAIVGMAALFTAIVRAPLTGLVLIVEMTGNYDLMLPLLVAVLLAYAVADWVGDLPIYEALLERDLQRG